MHVDFDGVGADFLVPAVELLGELLLVDHAAAAEHQHFQHAELARRQLERFATQRCATAGGVELERAVREHRAAARLAAADQRAQARLELGQIEGLGEVVVGAEVEALDALVEGVVGGEHQHRHARAAVAQPAQHFEAAELGQPQVEDHHVVGLGRQHVVGFAPVVHAIHGVIGLAQGPGEAVGQHRVVFNDEDAHYFSFPQSK